MTVLIGYVPTPGGEAALATGLAEAAAHGADIVDAFTSAIEETGARLVVIGMRRRSPVGKLMMGSDVQRLLLTLDVPILAVKPAR